MTVDEQLIFRGDTIADRNSLRAVATSMCWTTGSTIFLVVAATVLNLIIGNVFGDEGLGVYSLAVAIYLFLGTVAGLGQYVALVKYTAEYIDEPHLEREYFGASLILAGTAGLLTGTVLLVLSGSLARFFCMPDLAEFLVILSIAVPFFELNKVGLAHLAGLRRMRAFAVGESLRYVFAILATIAGVVWYPERLCLTVVALLIAEIMLAFYVAHVTRLHRSASLRNFRARAGELLRFGVQVVFLRIMGEMDSRLDLAVTGYFLSQGEVGTYSVGLMLARGLTVFPNALQKIALPLMAELYAKKRLSALENFINQAMQVMAVILTLAAITMAALFPQIILLLYPKQDVFLSARPAFNVLLAGFVFRGIGMTIVSIFASVGRPDVELKTAPVTLAVNFVVAIVLAVSGWGMPGIAAGTAASGIIAFALWTVLTHPVVGVKVHYWRLLVMPLLGLGVGVVIMLLAPYVSTLILIIPFIGLLCLVALRLYRFDLLAARLFRPPHSG